MTPLDALKNLVAVVRAMEAEQDGEKPTEEQYLAALANAEAAIDAAVVVDGEYAEVAPAKPKKRAKARS